MPISKDSSNSHAARSAGLLTVYFRIALGIGFLSAVADRLGLWGAPGTPYVSWGNFHNFLAYTAKLNPWFPASWIPMIGWTATICEICFGVALIIGFRTRLAAGLSGCLALVFALAMLFSIGVHAPLNYSVFAVSAGSFLLAAADKYPWTLDSWREENQAPARSERREARQIAV